MKDFPQECRDRWEAMRPRRPKYKIGTDDDRTSMGKTMTGLLQENGPLNCDDLICLTGYLFIEAKQGKPKDVLVHALRIIAKEEQWPQDEEGNWYLPE